MLKDGKSYPFLKATINEDYPRLVFARQMKRDGAKYFGPFTSGSAIRDTIELTNKLFGLRSCRKNLPRDIGKDRPCLYHQMGQCKAPCQGCVTAVEYKEDFEKAVNEGKNLGTEIKLAMEEFANTGFAIMMYKTSTIPGYIESMEEIVADILEKE